MIIRILKVIIATCYSFSIFINAFLLWNLLPVKKYVAFASPNEQMMQPIPTVIQRAVFQIEPTVIPIPTDLPMPTIVPTELPITPTITPSPTINIPTPTLIPTLKPTLIPTLAPTSTPYPTVILPTVTPTPVFVVTNITYKDLYTKIRDIIKQSQGTWAVIVGDLAGNQELFINEKEIFHGASTTKILTAVTILDKIEKGQINLETEIDGQKIKGLLTRMINRSDNDAWDSLNKIATYEDRQKFGENMGMKSLDVSENRLSAYDMDILLKGLYFGQILTAKDRFFLFSLMQNTQDETRISAPIPLNIPVVHKSGNYNDVYHDVGFVMSKKPYMIVVMGKGTNVLEGRGIIQSVSKEVFDYYQNN